MVQWVIVAPIKGFVEYDALRAGGCVVGDRSGQILLGSRGVVATRRRKIPRRTGRDGSREGIEQQPVRIEAKALAGRVRAFDAVGVELTRYKSRDPDVPNIASAVARRSQIDNAARLRVVRMVEQFEAHTARVTAEYGKIDPSGPLLSA